MDKPKLHKCPACGQLKGAEIIYGMPDREAGRFIDMALLIAGGCMREGDAPDYQCRACGHEFNLYQTEEQPMIKIFSKIHGYILEQTQY